MCGFVLICSDSSCVGVLSEREIMSGITAGSLTFMSPINLFQYELHICDMRNFELNTFLFPSNNNHPCIDIQCYISVK